MGILCTSKYFPTNPFIKGSFCTESFFIDKDGLGLETTVLPCLWLLLQTWAACPLLPEPPVMIVQPRKAPSVLKASTGETVTLACVLSHGNVPVRWVKDGVTLGANSGLILEEEGTQHCLVIPAAGPEHSGKYVCNAVDDTMTFTIQVSGECSAQRPW